MRCDEIITEMSPLAMPGDWNEGEVHIADQSLLVYQKYWQKVGTLIAGAVSYDISRCGSSYVVGREDQSIDKFVVIGRLDLYPPEHDRFGYTSLASVEQVVVKQNFRGYHIATELYRFVVKSGITLLSDMSQYFGARRLWARLSRQADMVVDVVDTAKNAVVARDVKLHHGKLDADFDTAYWSYDIRDGKQNIRFTLRDIAPSGPSMVSLGSD